METQSHTASTSTGMFFGGGKKPTLTSQEHAQKLHSLGNPPELLQAF